jgi:hypothetical protein
MAKPVTQYTDKNKQVVTAGDTVRIMAATVDHDRMKANGGTVVYKTVETDQTAKIVSIRRTGEGNVLTLDRTVTVAAERYDYQNLTTRPVTWTTNEWPASLAYKIHA